MLRKTRIFRGRPPHALRMRIMYMLCHTALTYLYLTTCEHTLVNTVAYLFRPPFRAKEQALVAGSWGRRLRIEVRTVWGLRSSCTWRCNVIQKHSVFSALMVQVWLKKQYRYHWENEVPVHWDWRRNPASHHPPTGDSWQWMGANSALAESILYELAYIQYVWARHTLHINCLL